MDRAASISAKRHSEEIVVTSSVNHVSFGKAIPIGTTVTIEAKVSRAFITSMEVFIDVWIDDDKGRKIKANEAIYTFVAVDENGRPTKIDKISPETEQEKKRAEKVMRKKSRLKKSREKDMERHAALIDAPLCLPTRPSNI